ncbi:hypothetical protein M0811_14201 [Anaeramoeba ignava]|uniref:Uncharacterized protein n=1 Tax=Anaeramoeba ignava TaxID=1746090 RepID=A0A9Q0RHA9_ANAIG|nr:hypothetical protein M0811_14201 [Anaeramoeba ignava]
MSSVEKIPTFIGAGLGTIGALMLIITFTYFKEYRYLYRKLVFILSFYDFFQSALFLLPGHSNKYICRAQYFLLAIFGSTPSFWSAAIALISYLKIVKEFPDRKLNQIQKWLHLLMLITVIVLVSVFSYTHDYSTSDTYCRLKKLINLISKGYFLSKIIQPKQVWVQLRMSLIPLIEMVVMAPATIRRIRDMINPNGSQLVTLDIIHSLLVTSQGFWDFWIFVVFDPEIRKKIRNFSSYRSYQKNFHDLESFSPKSENDLLLFPNPFENEPKEESDEEKEYDKSEEEEKEKQNRIFL